MEIYEINNLDCSIKANRKKLVKEVLKVIGCDELPSKKWLEKFAIHVGDKYGMTLQYAQADGEKLICSLKYDGKAYHMLEVRSYKELILKWILLSKALKDYQNVKVK